MSSYDAFQKHEEQAATAIMADTWGYPKPSIKYPVSLLLCKTEDGLETCIKSIIPGDLGNPFFWDDFSDWMGKRNLENGEVYRWCGTYMKYKNGNYRFMGRLTHMILNF